MRTLALVALVCCGVTSREAAAQSFYYAPPGSGYGDYYGANLGNGIGIGYGVGVGVSPNLLNSSVTDTYIPPFQELCDSNPSFISRGAVTPSQTSFQPNGPKKKTKVSATKKSVPKVAITKAKLAKKSSAK
ncbi:MAG: hypothetical protein JWP89_2021 [Schlesneria sp.]|nr:hypothetical protein [Schlesneria sp.]